MTRFDISGLAPEYRRFVRLSRWIFITGLCLTLVGMAYVGSTLTLDHAWDSQQFVTLGLIAFVAFFFGLFVATTGPGATSVDVEESGVTFHYRRGRIRRYLWSDPKLNLVLDRTSGVEDNISHGHPMQAAMGAVAFENMLTPGAMGAILESAHNRSLRISEAPSPRRGWMRITISSR